MEQSGIDTAPGTGFEQYVHHAFGPEGIFSKAKDFEYRPEQQDMALAVARALQIDAPLLVEAGTGVGKSLGYLLPAVKFAMEYERKAIISTHTINLQEQLFNKDIPLLKKAMRCEFSAALLKGRQNYVCKTRLKRAMAQMDSLFTYGESAELRRILDWSMTCPEGTLTEMPFRPSIKVWAMVCSEPHACTLKNCGPNCPYQVARKRVQEANVVVLNHTLFFSLLAQAEDVKDGGFIYPGDFIILDEAHTIENIAAKQMGIQLSESALQYELTRMYNPRTQKGTLKSYGNADLLQRVMDVQDSCGLFFEQAKDDIGFSEYQKIVRLHQGEWTQDILSLPLAELSTALKNESGRFEDNTAAKDELNDLSSRMNEARDAVQSLMSVGSDDHVYWAERSGAELNHMSISCAPVEVAPLLREKLFQSGRAAILASATLSAGDDQMKYFAGRVGAHGVHRVQIGSPFDYQKQMKLIVSRSMPEPDNPEYKNELPRQIQHYIEMSQGRAFVLFTSYKLMLEMAAKIRPFLEEKGWNLFVQGQEMQRSAMLKAFKEDTHSVLFGTDSFWTGVDVPGESLSNVIVTRLPFEVPDHPMVESRFERIRQRGGMPFFEYSLPEAALKLRQGVGRLIRTKSDQGIVVILDSRVVTKSYGRRFINSLPKGKLEIV